MQEVFESGIVLVLIVIITLRRVMANARRDTFWTNEQTEEDATMTKQRSEIKKQLREIQQTLITLVRTDKESFHRIEKMVLGEALIMIKGILNDWELRTEQLTEKLAD